MIGSLEARNPYNQVVDQSLFYLESTDQQLTTVSLLLGVAHKWLESKNTIEVWNPKMKLYNIIPNGEICHVGLDVVIKNDWDPFYFGRDNSILILEVVVEDSN